MPHSQPHRLKKAKKLEKKKKDDSKAAKPSIEREVEVKRGGKG